MKYNGKELKEFTSDKPVVFDPPKKMVVWDERFCGNEEVYAYIPGRERPVILLDGSAYHCAEIPEEPQPRKATMPRKATKLEVLKWLAQGNGLAKDKEDDFMYAWFTVSEDEMDEPCDYTTLVRKWDDTQWHEPTVNYMGLEG